MTSFLGTLPVYVDAVTPPRLVAGDELRLPVQVVNTTPTPVRTTLTLDAVGAAVGGGRRTVQVPAEGSVVEFASLTAPRPGSVSFKAALGDTDAVERIIDVIPKGQRVTVTRGGSLAATRTFTLEGPADALPDSEAVHLQVFPGALGFVRQELSAAPGRGGVAEDAYLLQLLGTAPSVLRSLGAEPDLPTIRELTIVATQRVMRHARAPSVDAATLMTEAALLHPENPVLSRLGERLSAQVASAQRPDGTCQGADGWTLQRLLVTTAECARAVSGVRTSDAAAASSKQRASGFHLRAAGAFERNLGRVNDGYTAAAILASGAVAGQVASTLQATVLQALAEDESAPGARHLVVDKGVVRPDGLAPSTTEATALAILALAGVRDAPLAELGTHLLGTYHPSVGWGDGRTNLVALRAVAQLFQERLPSSVSIFLLRDGKTIAEGVLGPDKLRDVVRLSAAAPESKGKHEWTVRADPPVPGLGFTFSLSAYTPWKEQSGGGLELTTDVPPSLRVGVAGKLALTASMPAGIPSALRLALPAGVQPDTGSLDALVAAGSITRYETEDGAVTLRVPSLAPGATFQATIRVIPTLAGTLSSAASSLTPDHDARLARYFAPKTWKVR